jgi:hypothetical protein
MVRITRIEFRWSFYIIGVYDIVNICAHDVSGELQSTADDDAAGSMCVAGDRGRLPNSCVENVEGLSPLIRNSQRRTFKGVSCQQVSDSSGC